MALLTPFVALEQVALLSCNSSSELDPRQLPSQAPRLSLSQNCTGLLEANNRIQIRACAHLLGHINAEQVLSIQATYGVYYSLPPHLKPTQQDVDEFARRNGMFNAWPYLRELLGNLSGKMGLPLPPLPLMRANVPASLGEE